MKLLYAPASPYSSKVRLAAEHCDLSLELEPVDTKPQPDHLVSANPLGKIPTLVLDDGTTIYDSPVICEYFDRISGNLLIPQTTAEWLQAKRVEALADGITDAAILIVYEERYRPEERREKSWTDRQWQRASRGLDRLETEVDTLPEELGIGHYAIASLLGWMEIRFAGRWQEGRPRLAAWFEEFPTRCPAFAELGPKV